MASTHKSEHCRNKERNEEHKAAQIRAARVMADPVDDMYATDSDDNDAPSAHIGRINATTRNLFEEDTTRN